MSAPNLTFFDDLSEADIRRALEALVQRGVVEVVYDCEGVARFQPVARARRKERIERARREAVTL